MNSPDKNQNDTSPVDAAFFSEFPIPSYDDWRREVARLLKGAPFEKRMLTVTDEGITLQPLYRSEDTDALPHRLTLPGFPPFVRGGSPVRGHGNDWAIAQEINYPNAKQYNEALRFDISRGLTAINLPLDFAARTGHDPDTAKVGDVGYHGVSIACAEDLETALAGVALDDYAIYIHAGTSGLPFLCFLLTLAKKHDIKMESLSGAIAADPIGELAAYGKLPALIDQLMDEIAVMTIWAGQQAPRLGTVWVHGEKFHNAGANAVQELACTMATAVYYLRQMEKRNIEPAEAVPHFRFNMGSGSHLFMEIAKFRAARILWNNITEACGVPEEKRALWLHAESSRYNKTAYDPYVNMLRATTEAFACAAGGTDSMHVAPFDDCFRTPDELSRRTARNTQVILREEVHMAQTIDPGGGSWYIEKLTAEIVDTAWELFCEIDKKGGMYQTLKDGFIQEMIAVSAKAKADALAARTKTSIGTNIYANPTEEPLAPREIDFGAFHQERSAEIAGMRSRNGASIDSKMLRGLLTVDPAKLVMEITAIAEQGATLGEIVKNVRDDKAIRVEMTPLPAQRLSMSFELLHRRVTAARTEGKNTKIFLATLGPIRKYMPRLDFATSFFEVGGFEVIRPAGFDNRNDAVAAAMESEANVFVLCGLDETYEADAEAVTSAIRAQQPQADIILAGKPADVEFIERLQAAGINKFIHVKSNVLLELKDTASRMGVLS